MFPPSGCERSLPYDRELKGIKRGNEEGREDQAPKRGGV